MSAALPVDSPDDAVTFLTEQHRRLETLLEALVDSTGADERRQCLQQVGDELAAHLGAEEMVFYPAVRALGNEDILLESLEEHLSLKRLLADLLALAPEETTFAPKCKVLDEQARHHHEEEEEHLFPGVREHLDTEARQRLGREMRSHQQQLRSDGAPREAVLSQTDAAEPLA